MMRGDLHRFGRTNDEERAIDGEPALDVLLADLGVSLDEPQQARSGRWRE